MVEREKILRPLRGEAKAMACLFSFWIWKARVTDR